MANKEKINLENLTDEEIFKLHHAIESGGTGEITKLALGGLMDVQEHALNEEDIAQMRVRIKRAAESAADRKARDALELSRVEPIPHSKRETYKKLRKEHLEG